MMSSPQKKPPLIVTRPESNDSSDKLCTLLSHHEIEAYHLPLVSLNVCSKPSPIQHLEQVTWIIFTSPKAVHLFFKSPLSEHINPTTLHFAVIGETTNETLSSYGYQAELMPNIFVSDSLAEALLARLDKASPQHILWPCNQNHDAILTNAFKASPHKLTPFPLYESIPQTKLPDSDRQIWLSLLDNPDTIITFTSPSAVLGAKHCNLSLVKHRIVSIGPKTTQACRDNLDSGTPLTLVEASPHSFQGILQAIQSL